VKPLDGLRPIGGELRGDHQHVAVKLHTIGRS
jgi:hypothetical protein